MIQIQNRMNRKQRTHKLCKKSILHFLLVFQIPLESITLHLYCTVEKLWKYLNLVLLLQNVNNNTSQINQCLNKLTFYQIPVSLSFKVLVFSKIQIMEIKFHRVQIFELLVQALFLIIFILHSQIFGFSSTIHCGLHLSSLICLCYIRHVSKVISLEMRYSYGIW